MQLQSLIEFQGDQSTKACNDMISLPRYVKDLLPDLPSHPAALRATIRSPTEISEADLSLWRDGRGSKRGQGAGFDRVCTLLEFYHFWISRNTFLTLRALHLSTIT